MLPRENLEACKRIHAYRMHLEVTLIRNVILIHQTEVGLLEGGGTLMYDYIKRFILSIFVD